MAESAETHAKKKDAVIAEPVVARAFLEHIFEPAEKACHGQEPEPVEAIEQLAVEDCELATAQFLELLPIDDVQAASVQRDWAADQAADRLCGGEGRQSLSHRLSALTGRPLLAVHMSERGRGVALAGGGAGWQSLGKLGKNIR